MLARGEVAMLLVGVDRAEIGSVVVEDAQRMVLADTSGNSTGNSNFEDCR